MDDCEGEEVEEEEDGLVEEAGGGGGGTCIIRCEDQEFVCLHPEKSLAFQKQLKNHTFSIELSEPLSLVEAMVTFINEGFLDLSSLNLMEAAHFAMKYKILELENALVSPIAEYYVSLPEEERARFLGIPLEIHSMEKMWEEVLWLPDAVQLSNRCIKKT